MIEENNIITFFGIKCVNLIFIKINYQTNILVNISIT